MMEKQSDGSFKPVWFDVPDGSCWTGGIPSIDGICVYCGHKIEDHQKREKITVDKKRRNQMPMPMIFFPLEVSSSSGYASPSFCNDD